MRQVFQNLPVAGLILNASAQILEANPLAQDLFQRSNRALTGSSLNALFPGAQALQDLFVTARDQGVSASSPELEVSPPNLSAVRVSAHLSVLDLGEWLLVLVPVSGASKADRSSDLQMKAGSLSAMAAMLAHEIKNPLAAISGAAQLMAGQNDALASLIVGETRRISQLLDTMELFSSPEDLDIAPVNIHAILGEVIGIARLSFGQHVRFVEDYDPSLPPVLGNSQMLHRICLNLIKNACEACDGNAAQVRLRTRFQIAERRRRDQDNQGTDLPINLSFIDNGRGIPSHLVDQIFDAFISSKDQGRGLGLAYVVSALASLGGDIAVDSDVGRTEFQLRLPRA